MERETQHPILFMSYSHTSDEHKTWVRDLCDRLIADGVDVRLDQYDLKLGDDAYVFMEQMVANPEVRKVVCICDKKYADKADQREGGVGAETQIITPELYNKVTQDKFVFLVVEKDELGNFCVPAYAKSRLHIDFTGRDLFSEKYDELLRWVYDRPLLVKPPKGTIPPHLLAVDEVVLQTASEYQRAVVSIREGRPNAEGALRDYFDKLANELKKLKIEKYEGFYDDTLVKNIDIYTPYRDEYVAMILLAVRYLKEFDFASLLHPFLEQLLSMHKDPDSYYKTGRNSDIFRFIAHEMFLYTVVVLVKYELFADAAMLLDKEYVVESKTSYSVRRYSYLEFREYIESLDERKKRTNSDRIFIHSDLLLNRECPLIKIKELQQAELVLVVRSMCQSFYDPESVAFTWFPYTLINLIYGVGNWKLFYDARSKRHFEKIKPMLGAESLESLRAFLSTNPVVKMDSYHHVKLSEQIEPDLLGTKP